MVTGRDYPKAEFESIYAELGFGGWPTEKTSGPSCTSRTKATHTTS